MTDIPVIVRRAVIDYAGASPLTVTPTTLFEDLELDSLDVTELVLLIEDRLGVLLGAVPLNVRSVGELTRCVEGAL